MQDSTSSPDRYGVVGHPVAHSKSPFIHGLFAQQTGHSITYELFDFTPEEFGERVRAFFASGGRGLNVTLPHKLAAARLADELTSRAALAAAANTLALREDGRILGDNTDGFGLVRDLTENLGIRLGGARILILGAGGATRGAIGPLLELGPERLVIANRTPERARALAADFARLGPVTGCGFEELGDSRFDVVINATSASLSGEVPPLDPAIARETRLCYDMAYGPDSTPFVRWALRHGCPRAEQGLGMLVEQAAESFRIWRGVRPDTRPVLAALAAQISASAGAS
ncbi:MAG: shikimate dehydrogenase [Pseudomonadota bacterium]|jgi:shikimate 5-dehydrogenase|nr:MAG: shikimate dehydrogenase [Pseudomonadota bacterium]